MSDAYIDQDLNYDVEINVKKFKNPKSPSLKKLFETEEINRFFNNIEEFCEFMTEVGNNHPNGVNIRYLLNLMTYYSTSKALSNLEAKGLITSDMNDEGEIVYSLTALGRKVSDTIK